MYRNCCYRINKSTGLGEIILFTWDETGKPVYELYPYQSYFYVEKKGGEAKSMFGTEVTKKVFTNSIERKKAATAYSNQRIYENHAPVRQFLIEKFEGQQETDEFRKYPLKTFYFDIEIAVENEFPAPDEAKYPINVMTIYDNVSEKFYVWVFTKENEDTFRETLKQKYSNQEKLDWKLKDVEVFVFNSETNMLYNFLSWMENNYPDFITGWNILDFDIPYLVNRMKNFFGTDYTRLSPIKNIYAKTLKIKNNFTETNTYVIDGISCIDYLLLYKLKFATGSKPSYKLDAVAEDELGVNKLEYTGTIRDFYKRDFHTFVLYNIQDVHLVVKLEEKLKYLELTRLICNIGLCEYEAINKSGPYIYGAITLECHKNNLKVISSGNDDSGNGPEESFAGAFVFEPQIGLYKRGFSSLDFNSLYPNIMITLNISPETKVGKIIEEDENGLKIRTSSGVIKNVANRNMLKDKCVVSANKIVYLNPNLKKGIIPTFLDRLYMSRKDSKKKMLQVEQIIEDMKKHLKTLTDKDEKKAYKLQIEEQKIKRDRLNSVQHALKILLNSVYGQFGSKYFQMYDLDNAEAVTLTGQHVIKKSYEFINTLVKEKYKADYDAVIYGDTDSLYFNCKAIVDYLINKDSFTSDNIKQICNYLDKEIVPVVNQHVFKVTQEDFFSPLQKIEFKRETFCTEGYFVAKKRYAVHVRNSEGVDIDKFKYTGVDVKKNEIPIGIKSILKDVIENSMKEDWTSTKFKDFINDAWNKFRNMNVNEIAIWKGYNTEKEDAGFLQSEKGTGLHARAAQYYNQLLIKLNISDKYDDIQVGDRIRYVYLKKNNSYNINVIAWKDKFPVEFQTMFEVDYETMFEKIVMSPLKTFIEINKWPTFTPAHEELASIMDL